MMPTPLVLIQAMKEARMPTDHQDEYYPDDMEATND